MKPSSLNTVTGSLGILTRFPLHNRRRLCTCVLLFIFYHITLWGRLSIFIMEVMSVRREIHKVYFMRRIHCGFVLGCLKGILFYTMDSRTPWQTHHTPQTVGKFCPLWEYSDSHGSMFDRREFAYGTVHRRRTRRGKICRVCGA